MWLFPPRWFDEFSTKPAFFTLRRRNYLCICARWAWEILSLYASGHTFQTKLYRLHLHNNIQNWWLNSVLNSPSVLSSEVWTYHSRSKQIPLCRALTVGGNAIEWIPDWLSGWLFHCLSVLLSAWPVDMQLHKYPQQEQQQQLRFKLLFRALCRHTHFRGKPLPFLHRAAPIYCLFLSFMCFFVCVSTVCLAATCSPQAKILVLTNPLAPLSCSLCRSPSAFHVQLQSEMTFDYEYIHCVLCAPE